MSSFSSLAHFRKSHSRTLSGLYSQVSANHSFISEARFTEVLYHSARHHFSRPAASTQPGSPAPQIADDAVSSYLRSLHAGDLYLAAACADGVSSAWDFFVGEFRPALYSAARAIAGDAGRELADSLYADLFGLEVREGRRRSLLNYFHGRSKLSTWLRSVLAQRHVDALRASSRMISLDAAGTGSADGNSAEAAAARSALAQSAACSSPDPDRNRYLSSVQAALQEALAALPPRDRLRLSSYYVQELTLAQIARILGEHEATVSRKLDRTRRDIRSAVERQLREHRRLSDAQIQLCFDYAREEWPFDLTRAIS